MKEAIDSDHISGEVLGNAPHSLLHSANEITSTMPIRIHIGSILKEALTESGMSVMDFADALHCSRKNVYKIFSKAHLNTDILVRSSLILRHDFFADFSKAIGL